MMAIISGKPFVHSENTVSNEPRFFEEIWKLQSSKNLPMQPFKDAEELVKRPGSIVCSSRRSGFASGGPGTELRKLRVTVVEGL